MNTKPASATVILRKLNLFWVLSPRLAEQQLAGAWTLRRYVEPNLRVQQTQACLALQSPLEGAIEMGIPNSQWEQPGQFRLAWR
jgi:hypothetical protein